MEPKQRPPKAVVIGGSIAGLSCAHALLAAGWEVTVIEKSAAPPGGSPTGAGLSLEPQAREIIGRWLSDPGIINDASLPLSVELHRAVDSEKKISKTLIRDDNFIYRCLHWADLHSTIYKALPPGIVRWGHRYLSVRKSYDNASVRIDVQVIQTNEIVEIVADLLVGADGCLSFIRQHFLPDHNLRYSGYSAWRGVFDYSEDENSKTIVDLRRAYPELGNCLYFDLADSCHCVLFQLRSKRINWIWYFNSPEHETKGSSMTIKVSSEMVHEMHEEAEKVWNPELAGLMKDTKEPFINLIYDSDPLPPLPCDNVVLVGDAAHPTTPHGSRSTNMSILDAEVLGLCMKKWGVENLGKALQEYYSIRYPVTSKQVLHSRYMGRLKQGLQLHNNKVFDPRIASLEECKDLQHRNLPFFDHVPSSI